MLTGKEKQIMVEYQGKQITIMSCSNCNANCEHCYISYKGNFIGNELLDLCKQFDGKYKIIINGTEVLLHNDYFPALEIANQNRILTNGIVIYNNPEILEKIKKAKIYRIAMSYHYGSEVSHVSKQLVEKCITLIKNAGLFPELMCTITTENYQDLDSICAKTVELGVKTLRLFNCINTGKCEEKDNNLCLSDKDLEIFFEQLYQVRQKYSKDVLTIKRNGTFGPDCSHSSKFKCIAGVDEVIITPDYNVYPCIYLARKGFEIGKCIDGKVMLFEELENPGDKCLVHQVFNKNTDAAFVKKIMKEVN